MSTNGQKGRKPLINGRKVIAFWSNPITLIPNLGRTKTTTPARSNPSKKIGRRLGLFGLPSASITSPSITLSSRFLENSLEINSPTAIARTNMIINRSIGFITVQKLQIKIVNKLQISGSKLRQVSVITSQGG